MDLFEKLSVKGKSTIAFLPIKPVYANRLLSGEKLFEYRRASIKENLSHIVIYASSPMKKIIGVAKVASIHKDSLTATWENTTPASGISYKLYK